MLLNDLNIQNLEEIIDGEDENMDLTGYSFYTINYKGSVNGGSTGTILPSGYDYIIFPTGYSSYGYLLYNGGYDSSTLVCQLINYQASSNAGISVNSPKYIKLTSDGKFQIINCCAFRKKTGT